MNLKGSEVPNTIRLWANECKEEVPGNKINVLGKDNQQQKENWSKASGFASRCLQQRTKITMTEKDPEPHVVEEEDDLDGKLNYKPPPQKSLKELQEMDKDDESLAKYKKTLLGDGPVVADPTAPNVVVTRLTLVCDTAPGPITMDLTGDLEALKKKTFVLKEGAEYRVKINFKVNKDIVSGLKYVQHTYRTGAKVDKATFMVGSYGPRLDEYEFLTPPEEAPKGMIARGTYHNKSFFTDDDKHNHLTWEWNLSIKKEWTE
ncbi:rho GDP-dissociation inhibitor 2 isoform X1 [Sarcophilus harrisii]|uniref:rho GDP-dissociation inhibitor 2 isoform X1 n=2 Tax=Sarcophilus harrisii TaxID=9305 RepID=UPI001301C8E8|nr:rho GDP-dissociation inhibitor 2 isoform X1 [Sarcophilus harrisii]